MIEATGLAKNFGPVAAVRDVSFRADDGRVTALIGPNGAGKSTTLRMLYTLVEPTRGDALVDGNSVTKDPAAVRRAIGALPHNPGLYPRLTAVENVRYFGQLQGMAAERLEARIDDLVSLLDMREFADRRTDGFSQGQRMKVALARALVHDPLNLVLDEPTNGLDVMATRSLRELILNLRAAGTCVLLSSHVMQEIENLADELVIIGDGQVKFRGSQTALVETTGIDNLEDAFVEVVERGNALGAADGFRGMRRAGTGQEAPQ